MSKFLLPSVVVIAAVVWFLYDPAESIPKLDHNASYESLCQSGHMIWLRMRQYDAAIQHFRVAFSKVNEISVRQPCPGLDEVFANGSELTAFFVQRVKVAKVKSDNQSALVNFLLTHRLDNGKPITQRIFEASTILMAATQVDLPLEPCLLLAGWVHSISLPSFIEMIKTSDSLADTISALHSILNTCLLGPTWQAPVSARSDLIRSVRVLYVYATITSIHSL